MKHLIFAILLCTFLYAFKPTPLESPDSVMENNLNRFRNKETILLNKLDKYKEANEALYIELQGWLNHANRMRAIWKIPDSLEMNYTTKVIYFHSIHPKQ